MNFKNIPMGRSVSVISMEGNTDTRVYMPIGLLGVQGRVWTVSAQERRYRPPSNLTQGPEEIGYLRLRERSGVRISPCLRAGSSVVERYCRKASTEIHNMPLRCLNAVGRSRRVIAYNDANTLPRQHDHSTSLHCGPEGNGLSWSKNPVRIRAPLGVN